MIFKRLFFASVFLFASSAAHAQINIPSIINVLADPSGTCTNPGVPLQYNTQLNHLSACQGASPGPYSWALVSGGGGGGSLILENNSVSQGSITNLNLLPGTNMSWTTSVTSGVGSVTPVISGLVTPAQVQDGQLLAVTTTSSSTTTFTGIMALNDPLNAYSAGAQYLWIQGTTACAGGTMTLNIDSLGAVPLKQADGITNLSAPQCLANATLQITYDATNSVFRLQTPGGGGGIPPGQAVTVSQNCGVQTNCYTVYDDVQVAMTAVYTAGSYSGGSTATLVTTHDNDSGGEYLVVPTATNNVSAVINYSAAPVQNTVAVAGAFKIASTATVGACWGNNNTSTAGTTMTLAVSPTGGSGHMLVVWARGTNNTNLQTISFSGGTGNTYSNIALKPVGNGNPTGGSATSQMGYTTSTSLAGGSYNVTATFSLTGGYASMYACELSGMSTGASVLDASGSFASSGNTSVYAVTTPFNTTGNDLVFLMATVGSTSGTYSAGNIGQLTTTITTQTSDPPFASTDVGKKVLLSTNCDSGNGYVNCYQSFPATTVAVYNSAHSISVYGAATLSSASTGTNFTGWLEWGHDDATQLAAAWAQTLTTAVPGQTLLLPCGQMFIGSPPFLTSSTGSAYTPNIVGCGGGSGTVLIPTADFNYSAATTALIYNYVYANESGFGTFFQNPVIYSNLSNFTIWGGGVDGANVQYNLPMILTQNTNFTNVVLVGWNWNFGPPVNGSPAVSGMGINFTNSTIWSAGNGGLYINGVAYPSLVGSSCSNSFTGVQGTVNVPAYPGYGLQLIQTGSSGGSGEYFTSSNCQFNPPNHQGPTDAAYVSGNSGNFWTSHGDQIGGLMVNGGTVDLVGTQLALLGNYGLNIQAGTVTAIDTEIDKLITSSGTSFIDLGHNYSCSSAPANYVPCVTGYVSWTANPLSANSLAAGTVFGSASATGTTLTTAKVALTSGWGSGTVVTPAGDSHNGSFVITESGSPSVSPVLTLTFPTPFAVAPASCQIYQTAGNFTLTNPVASSLSATGVVWTFTGTPSALDTYTFGYRCGP